MYFWCICGEEDDLHILVHHYLESSPFPWFFFLFPVFPLEFYLGRPGDRGSTPKRRCWASCWRSVACAGNGGPGAAVGTWSWSLGTAWPLVGGTCWLRSPPPSRSGLSGPRLGASAHVSVALGDGTSCGQVLLLPVHAVGVTVQPDAEVLHPKGRFLTPVHSRPFPLRISSSSSVETQKYQKRDLATAWLGAKILIR